MCGHQRFLLLNHDQMVCGHQFSSLLLDHMYARCDMSNRYACLMPTHCASNRNPFDVHTPSYYYYYYFSEPTRIGVINKKEIMK